MSNEPKTPGPEGFDEDEERTPIIVPAGVEDILKRIASVRQRIRDSRGTHDRTDELLVDVEQLVRRGGSDAQVRAIYVKIAAHCHGLSDHMRDEISVIFGNLGRAFERLSKG